MKSIIYVDGSCRSFPAGWAFALDHACRNCGTVNTFDPFEAELTAVIEALKFIKIDHIEIRCDNQDVVNGINGRRYPVRQADVKTLWSNYDKASDGRNIIAVSIVKRRKNKGLHGWCDRASRRMSNVTT